VSGARSQESG